MKESLPITTFTVLHFLLQNIHACLELRYVKRVLALPLLEAVPGSPRYLVGLMNLAGTSIPVIDLSLRVGMQRTAPYSLDMPILLCSDGHQSVGIVVDDVLGIVKAEKSQLQMGSEFTHNASPFLGVIPVNAELSLFLNLKLILSISLTDEETDFTIDTTLLSKAKKRHE